jgi:hypothetical protein
MENKKGWPFLSQHNYLITCAVIRIVVLFTVVLFGTEQWPTWQAEDVWIKDWPSIYHWLPGLIQLFVCYKWRCRKHVHAGVFVLFFEMVLICSPDWSEIWNSSASASLVLGLKAWSTMQGLFLLCLHLFSYCACFQLSLTPMRACFSPFLKHPT